MYYCLPSRGPIRTYLDILLGDVKIQVRDEEFRRRVVGRFIRRRRRCRRASTASSHDLIDCHANRSASSHHRFTSPADRGFSDRIPPRFFNRDGLLRRCWFFSSQQQPPGDFPVFFFTEEAAAAFLPRSTAIQFFFFFFFSFFFRLRAHAKGFDERVERLIDVHDVCVHVCVCVCVRAMSQCSI